MNSSDITQKPTADATYALNTVPEIQISTTETITASIKIGNGSNFFVGTYIPDFSNKVYIDFADLYQSKLSTAIPIADNYTEGYNPDFRKKFTVTLQGTTGSAVTVSYYVCNAKIKSSSTFEAWSSNHFLTNQAIEKFTNYEAKEFLSYLDYGGNTKLKVRFYESDGDPLDVTVFNNDTAGCLIVDVSYSRLIALANQLPGDLKGYYDLQLYNNKNELIATQRYVYREATGKEKYFLFVNALGGVDTMICTGNNTLEPETMHNVGRFGNQFVAIDDTDDMRTWEQKTGWFEHKQRNWVYELLLAKKEAVKYDPDNASFQYIVVTSSDISVSDEKRLADASFKYILTEDSAAVGDNETPSNNVIHNSTVVKEEEMADTTVSEEEPLVSGETEEITVEATKLFVYYETTSDSVSSEPVYYYINGSSTAAGSFVPNSSGEPVVIEIEEGQTISFGTQNTTISKIIVRYYA